MGFPLESSDDEKIITMELGRIIGSSKARNNGGISKSCFFGA